MLEALDRVSGELKLSPEILNLIAEIDEFKGKWEVFSSLVAGEIVGFEECGGD